MHTTMAAAALAVLLGLGLSCESRLQPKPGEEHLALSESGAWCWFADPRAICGGAGERLFAAWVTGTGDIQVGMLDARSGETQVETLHARFQRDDHDNPALLALPDGRLAAFYSKHGGKQMWLRTSKRPWDISAWTEERSIPVHKSNPPLPTPQRPLDARPLRPLHALRDLHPLPLKRRRFMDRSWVIASA